MDLCGICLQNHIPLLQAYEFPVYSWLRPTIETHTHLPVYISTKLQEELHKIFILSTGWGTVIFSFYSMFCKKAGHNPLTRSDDSQTSSRWQLQTFFGTPPRRLRRASEFPWGTNFEKGWTGLGDMKEAEIQTCVRKLVLELGEYCGCECKGRPKDASGYSGSICLASPSWSPAMSPVSGALFSAEEVGE